MPTTVRVRWRSFTRNNLRIRTPAIIAAAMALELKYANLMIAMLRYEPAELEGQKYVRTHTLSQSWKIDPATNPPQVLPSGIVCRVINDAKDPRGKYYATYVQGPWQVAIHQNRWIRAEGGENGPADPEIVALRAGFAREMREIVRRNIGVV